MPVIELAVEINAPVERVFDLSRSVPAHLESTRDTGEVLVEGPRGLLGLGDQVTWEARHLGLRQRLSARITEFDRPTHFRDSMVKGAFAHFDHDHYFEVVENRTIAREIFDYSSPMGLIGRLADAAFLERYMRSLLLRRATAIKRIAESTGWQAYVHSDG